MDDIEASTDDKREQFSDELNKLRPGDLKTDFKNEQSTASNDDDLRLFVCGGSRPYPARYSELYHPGLNQWSRLAEPGVIFGAAVKLSEDTIYLVSKYEKKEPQYYNVDKDEWSSGERLFEGCGVGYLVTMAGYIYYLPEDHDGYIGSLIRYDMATKTTLKCAPVQEPKESPSVVVHNHYIYVIGGSNTDSSLHATTSVQRYNSREDKWESVASMNTPRKSFSGCSYEDAIYVAGGAHDNCCLNTAEKYNPELDVWTEIAPIAVAREKLAMVGLLGRVYAIGGREDDLYDSPAVEAYDPVSNQWVFKSNLIEPRSSHNVFVIRKKSDSS